MTDEITWGPWIKHDDSGLPAEVSGNSLVLCDLSGDIIGPMMANEFDWCSPGDPIQFYRLPTLRAMQGIKALLQDLPEEVTV